ncbi:hypothetical protein AgCh_009057 [Apium graveolens]
MNNLERGQPSCIKSPKVELILKPKVNYPKSSLKNPLDTVYETPKPDENKLLSRSITFYKDPADSALKRRIAKVFRNGKEICVVVGHPQFGEAKREVKEQAAILAKLHAMKPTQQIPEQSSETTESKELKMQEESQQRKRFR